MSRFALGLLFASVCVTAPSLARAQAPGLQLAGSGPTTFEQRRAARREKFDERHHLEDFQRSPKRKGFYVGSALTTGMTAEFDSFIPSVGYRFEIGGGLTERLTLGISGGIVGHMDVLEGTAGVADIVMQGFVHRGLYMKLGLGATSHAPSRGRIRRPGFGGTVGVGYEFRPLRVLGVSLGVDYEGRVRTDGRFTQAVVFGLGLRAYLDFQRR
jgi:hypothetical protein